MNIALNPVILIVMGLAIITILFLLYQLTKTKHEPEKKETDQIHEYGTVIQNAETKAQTILDQASTQAATIISQAETAKVDIGTKTEEAIQKLTEEQGQLLHTNADVYFKEYQDSLTEVKKRYTEQLEKMLADMQATTEKEIQELKNLLKSQVTASESASAQQIQDDFAKAQIEIAEYKKHQIQKIDQSMNDILLKVSEEILGKIIPIRDHQQLIIDSLEQAKKEGLFNL